MDFIEVKIPYNEVADNTVIDRLMWLAIKGGANIGGTENGTTHISGISNNTTTYERFSYDAVAYIASIGGNVFNYQSYIKVNLTDEVPTGIRDSVIEVTSELDLTTIEKGVTWGQWISLNQPPITVDGETYISGYSHYSGFKTSEKKEKHLDGVELTLLRSKGYTVLNKNEFQKLLSNE